MFILFHNQVEHKTLYNLLSPNPAVSCVADKQVSHRDTLFSILLYFL